MSVVKMADAAAARREARRRKILENSQNRLQIISGKPSNESHRELPARTPIPEPNDDISMAPTISFDSSSTHMNGVPFNPPADLLSFLSGTHDINASGDLTNDLAPLLAPGLPRQEEEAPNLSVWEKILTYKYDIVLLSLLLQLLYSFSITFDNNYLFLPPLVYIVTKIIWFPTQNNSSVTNVLLLLNGMTPSRVQKLIYLLHCFGVVTRDIFVFLFTTICIQSLWIMLRDNLVTW